MQFYVDALLFRQSQQEKLRPLDFIISEFYDKIRGYRQGATRGRTLQREVRFGFD